MLSKALDRKDKTIITMLSADPQVPQEAMARELGLSQPSVAVRVRKLREAGAVSVSAGIDPFKLGLNVAKVDVAATNPAKVLEFFSGCPYFLNGYIVSGKSNLSIVLVAARISTLQSIVDGHLRRMPEVNDVDFNIVIYPAKPVVMPVDISTGGRSCDHGSTCARCESRKTGRCAGCPEHAGDPGWFF
jgi:DNA-binding Lrp family transcriptional regulator